MRKISFGIIFSSLLLVATGCSENIVKDTTDTQSSENSISIIAKQEIPSIDPSITNDVVGWEVLKNINEGMYQVGKDGSITLAGVTEDPIISEDGLNYTFKLNEASVWSSGEPVRAKDYVYGWQRTVDPTTESEVSYLFSALKNYDDIINGKKDASELGIKAVGEYELQIELENQVPYFTELLALPPFYPQNEKTTEEFGKEYASSSDKIVTNGAFLLTEFDGPGVDTSWTYTKNDSYWDQENVKLDKIEVSVIKEEATALNLFENGQADSITLSGELAAQMKDDPNYVVREMNNMMYMELNQKKSVMTNENLRQAISYGINREVLTKDILADGSIPAKGIIPTKMSFNPSTKKDFTEELTTELPFNENKAKDFFSKAKKELDQEKIEITLLTSDTESAKKVAEYIQYSLEETLDGLSVIIQSVPLSVRLDRGNNGEFDMLLGGWGAEHSDPSDFLDLFMSENANNSGRYANKEYDKYMIDSATTHASDADKRWADLLAAQDTLTKTMGIVPLYQRTEVYLRNPDLKNVLPAGPELEYKWSYLEK